MKINELTIPGCYLAKLSHFKDNRGEFVKTFNEVAFKGSVFEKFKLKEEFYSVSEKNVLRGLHFQNPPSAHNKLIYCIQGEVLDIILDIRNNSPTFGKYLTVKLNNSCPKLLFLPKGIAHGFLSLSSNATLVYKTDFVYSPEDDDGILYSSIGLPLPFDKYMISKRDRSFLKLKDFKSKFHYE